MGERDPVVEDILGQVVLGRVRDLDRVVDVRDLRAVVHCQIEKGSGSAKPRDKQGVLTAEGRAVDGVSKVVAVVLYARSSESPRQLTARSNEGTVSPCSS